MSSKNAFNKENMEQKAIEIANTHQTKVSDFIQKILEEDKKENEKRA